MAREKLITNEIIGYLARFNSQYPVKGRGKLTAGEALEKLNTLVLAGKLHSVKNIDDLPGESAIRKELQRIREFSQGDIDKVWSIGSCVKYNIPAEYIPELIIARQAQEKIQRDSQKDRTELGDLPGEIFTIRCAKWFCILYPLIETMENIKIEQNPEYKPKNIYQLIGKTLEYSIEYSYMEQAAEIQNIELDTSELDRIITGEQGYNAGSLGYILDKAVSKLGKGDK